MIDIEEKFVPWSARRYSVNVKGEIFSHENGSKTLLKPKKINSRQVVELSWIFGCSDYELALVLLITFDKINLPDHLYSQVEILYQNNDYDNLFLKNLIYRFKNGPIEVENFPGFYYIPFYTDYALSKSGRLININTGKEKVWTVSLPKQSKNINNGYYYSRVITNDGFSNCLFLHRALGFTFLPYDHTVFSLVMNHKDGNGSNNTIENLEWVTYRENNIHAVETGLRPYSSSPIVMIDITTGKEERFPSISSCARYLNNNRPERLETEKRAIQSVVSTGKLFRDRYKFKYEDTTGWIDESTSRKEKTIVGKNIFSDDLVIFENVSEASSQLALTPSVVLRQAREEVNVPYKGWNFRFLSDSVVWPKHTNKHLQIYSKYPEFPPNGLIQIDVVDNTEVFYLSIAEACHHLKISKQKLMEFTNTSTAFKGRYKFKIFDIRSEYD